MRRRVVDAALLLLIVLLIAAHAHHVSVLTLRYLQARHVAAHLPACDIDVLIDDLAYNPAIGTTTSTPGGW